MKIVTQNENNIRENTHHDAECKYSKNSIAK